ncbi:hypothetical protein BG418_12885 [Streptomyces sp. CBMA152]|nr:hypothetical protein [Streptomyces sp. CBMA152]
MLRVRFTAEDLLAVTFAPAPAPLIDLEFAVALVQRRQVPPVLSRWQHRARQSLPRDALPLLSLIPPTALGPMFLDPLSQGFEDGLDAVRAAPAELVRGHLRRQCPARRPLTPWVRALADQDGEAWRVLERALRAAHNSLVGPSWSRVRSNFDAERVWRTRLMAQHGIRTALASLAPGGRWEGTTLIFDCQEDVQVMLRGHGVVLLPSGFWAERPIVAVHDHAPSILIYPSAAPLPLVDERTDTEPLGALLGRTRAAVLELLARQHTTTDVAQALEISKPSASQHAKALREARLITTQRVGKAVWHACTPLGMDLLAAATDLPSTPTA